MLPSIPCTNTHTRPPTLYTPHFAPGSEMFGMWFVITMALAGVANHVLNPSAGRNMGYLAIAVQFGFAFAFPVRLDTKVVGRVVQRG